MKAAAGHSMAIDWAPRRTTEMGTPRAMRESARGPQKALTTEPSRGGSRAIVDACIRSCLGGRGGDIVTGGGWFKGSLVGVDFDGGVNF